ncbi:hypothetical protein PHMEG_0002874 [Phytophthora megakarya]|uniref:EF-hand domain-containing protein n=1 Tax=Phytophthora megakarya TaxID=4795 RepID=A0A225WXR5_9STRA|nr:hypothetical protein PHMEG_0002874 [Phytophthora megakarya]
MLRNTSTDEELIEQDEAETYEFLPESLRYHFKAELDDEKKQTLVRQARKTRSAHLVASLFSQPSLPKLLYSNSIERAITARMAFHRALEGLDAYFIDISDKVKQLEERYPSGIFEVCDVKIPTLVQTQRQITNVCHSCLSDCDIYLGMYEALPSPLAASPTPIVRFVACSTKSSMLDKRLECTKVLQSQPPGNQENLQKQRSMCITMQVMAAREALVVDDIADLGKNEICRFGTNYSSTGSFACFPLATEKLSDSKTIGVLSVDSCRRAHHLLPHSMSVEGLYGFLLRMQLKDAALELKKAKMDGARFLALTENDIRHKPSFHHLKIATRNRLLELIRALQEGSRIHISDDNERAKPFTQDNDALEFLEGVSTLSGKFLSNYRRVHYIQEIVNITRNPVCTAYDVYDILIRAITRSLEPLERVAVWKITKKKAKSSSTLTPSSSEWEIDVVASTSIPDDRLVPFINGEELKMKRVFLYKENEEAIRVCRDNKHTPLTRGNIVNIVSHLENSNKLGPNTGQPCENATYHISWSDRSLQAISWIQLRQLLPIRSMNTKHFQLRELCQRLQEEETRKQRNENKTEAKSTMVRINNPNGIAMILYDTSRRDNVKYVLEVDFETNFEPPQEMCNFLERAVSVADQALECVRGRQARHAIQKRVVTKNSKRFQSIGLNPSGDALRALQDIVCGVFEDIADCLPGVHVQIAELQAGEAQLKYTFTGKGSTVFGCSLNRGQGVSFKCLETKQPIVVGATSELRSRLQRVGAFLTQPQSVEDALPFIFVPLIHEDCCVGVLSVDSFQNVPKGRQDEVHPEAGTVEFLVSLAKLLASSIYAKRRSYALHEMQLSCQEPLRSPQQLIFYACRALKDVMVGVWKVQVVEIDGIRGKTTLVYEFSENEREQAKSWLYRAVRPMGFRWKELCTDTIISYLRQLQPGEEQTAESVTKLLTAITEDEQAHKKTTEMYQQSISEDLIAPANARRRSVGDMEKSKLLERQIADKYFLVLNEMGEASETLSPEQDRLSNKKYIAHAMKLFLGTSTCLYSDVQAMARSASKIFLTVTAFSQFHANCDQIYLQRVVSITSKYMTALQGRIRRSRERTIALENFRVLCQKILKETLVDITTNSHGGRYLHKQSPAREVEIECLYELQRDAIALIERTLGSPNVYCGMWEPALRILRYTTASKSSIMAGKTLKHGHGVSFLALEKQIPIVVANQDVNEDGAISYFRELRYFTSESLEDRKWPFIVVPLGNVGVLALDNMETYERETHELQPELGVVDFLRKISQSFAKVLTVIRERTLQHRQQLRDEALVRVMTASENFKGTVNPTKTTSLYLPHFVIQQIESAFNGVDAYFGVVEPLCQRIRFVCASSQSKMLNKTVDTSQSLSFRAFASQRTVVIPQLPRYFRQQEGAQQREHEHGQKLKYFGGSKPLYGPFVCVPIPFIGIISVDTFAGAAGGIFSPSFPEYGIVTFLEKVANFLGENIRTLAANNARKQLPTLFRGNRTTFPILFEEILAIISRNLLAVFDMQVLRYKRDEKSGQSAEKRLLASLRRHPEILIVHCSFTRDVADDEAALAPTVLVLRRVKGATWMYDEEFLLSILPLIDSLIAMVNVRVEGIVARRLATRKIDEFCLALESIPSDEAIRIMYKTTLPMAMETLIQAMSRDGDAYLGQRELTDRTKSQASQLQIRFVAASSRSLMQDITLNLEESSNFTLAAVQCLQSQKFVEITLSRDNSPVRALTMKTAQRIYLSVPMGDNYLLCADSLGLEAFVPGNRQAVEPDIVSFFKTSAARLLKAILSTRHRFSYDHLRSLTTRAHSDLNTFCSTILDCLRRDLVNVHSQQILALGEDLTSAFRLEAWHHSSARRPLKTLTPHYCSINGCGKSLIEHEIHSEAQVLLPMTNLPRALDLSRSRMQPIEGVEKHGAFTCACLTTMLDSSVAAQGGDAKLALCVFSQDAKVSEQRGISRMTRHSMIHRDSAEDTIFFTNYQRRYFFAFAAVAVEVYTHVFRACALDTFGAELFMTLQEYLCAKNGMVVRFNSEKEEHGSTARVATTTGSRPTTPIVLFSQRPDKTLPGQVLDGKLNRKVRQFEASNALIMVFMTKKSVPVSPRTGARKPTITSEPEHSKSSQLVKPVKRRRQRSLFGGKQVFWYGKKKRQDKEDEKAKQQQQLAEAIPQLKTLSPSRAQQLQHEKGSLHVFLRALDYQGRHDIIVFTVEKQSVQAASTLEKLVRLIKNRANTLAVQMMTNAPRGNEEINIKRFCSHDRGGGGFLLLSLLQKAQENFQEVEGAFGAAMRQFLTGAQATAQDTSSNAAEVLSALFGTMEENDGTASATPTTALLRVALVACGSKRETVVTLSLTDLLKEYLRMQAGRKLQQIDPTDKKMWGAIGRARALLRTFNDVMFLLQLYTEEPKLKVKAEANLALQTLVDLLLAQSAVVRYLKHLETEIARQQKQLHNQPAIILQCFIRQTQARMELKQRRREFHASLAIQCAFRQHLARRRVLFMKWTRAAIKVQRAYRRKRQRTKDPRSQPFTSELLSGSQKYGGRSSSVVANETLVGSNWRSDMSSFGTFEEFMKSKVGREQIKREEELMWRHRKHLEKQQAQLPRDEALRQDVGDFFELLDDAGRGELSRDRTAALISRLHVPLNEEEVADVVAMMDSDGSGGISLYEFMRWFAHEFPLLQSRAPRVCGVVTKRDWQWVIEQSARSAMLKRWRAMRARAIPTSPGGSAISSGVHHALLEEKQA